MAVSDGQSVSALADIEIPISARRALQSTVAHRRDVTRQHFAHIPAIDQFLDVKQCWADSRLQADSRLDSSLIG